MSHGVLETLRRWLAGRPSPPRPEPRRNETADAPRAGAEPLRTDGGGDGEGDDDHLRDLPDGAGCTEIWEHLSERHAESARADD